MLYFILILPTKNDCIELKQKIELFLANHLRLELNDKSRYYPDKMGVNFCGYRIFPTHRLLRTNSKKKIKKKVKKWNKKYEKNTLDIPYASQCLNSWIGHASHCNSYRLQQKIIQNCHFLLSSNDSELIERKLLQDIETNQKRDNIN